LFGNRLINSIIKKAPVKLPALLYFISESSSSI
jgi:hypothetical protein